MSDGRLRQQQQQQPKKLVYGKSNNVVGAAFIGFNTR